METAGTLRDEEEKMYKQYSMAMRAAVIVLDFAEDAENIHRLLKECFLSGREYAYYDRKTSENLLESGSITKELEKKTKDGELEIPENKFVFAFCLNLFETNKTVVDSIHRLMKDFSANLHPENASQVGYLICYRQEWEKESMLTMDELSESINEKVTNTIHAEYILYKGIFGSYQEQETALVRYLHMLSRDTADTKASLLNDNGYLCAFAFEGYDEETAEINEKQIGKYMNWLRKEDEKWSSKLIHKIAGNARDMIKGYFDMQGEFAYWQKLFPRTAQDYKRTRFFWHTLASLTASHIEEEKKRCETEYLECLEQEADWDELKCWIQNNVYYADFKKLYEDDIRKGFLEGVKRILQNEYANLIYANELEQKAINLYEKKLIENLNGWEDRRRAVEENLYKLQAKVKSDGKYRDLPDCLRNIKKNIKFSLPPAIVRQGCMEWLLLKEGIPAMDSPGNGMYDADIFLYPDLQPWEVQLISVAKYKSDNKLIDQILKKGKIDEGQDLG